MDEVVGFLTDLPGWLVYALLGAGAVIENVAPVVPADTVIVAGGFVAGLGSANPLVAFLVVWLFNTGGAAGMYALGRVQGRRFLATPRGRRMVAPQRLERMERFYARWGVAAVFAARFLPGFRALVPVFAGVAGLGSARVLPPLLAASAIWYGVLVRAGYLAGENLDVVADALGRANRALLVVSVLVAAALGAVWGRRAWVGARRSDRT